MGLVVDIGVVVLGEYDWVACSRRDDDFRDYRDFIGAAADASDEGLGVTDDGVCVCCFDDGIFGHYGLMIKLIRYEERLFVFEFEG